MKSSYRPAVREQILQRMSPPNRETVAAFTDSTADKSTATGIDSQSVSVIPVREAPV
jgi:hypothetical protein